MSYVEFTVIAVIASFVIVFLPLIWWSVFRLHEKLDDQSHAQSNAHYSTESISKEIGE